MDIPVHIVRWMAAFLLNRSHGVKVGPHMSDEGSPNGGVPQGTLSGPKSFLVQINDLQTPCDIVKYVDDSTIYEICNYNSISNIQDSALKWSKDNDMRINSSKTKEMVISFNKRYDFNSSLPNICIDNEQIERVDQVKILGVTVSNDLSWNIHIDNIIAKASKRMYMLYQLKRSGINQNDLLTIYVSVIRPVLEYACPVWHSCLPKYLSDNIEFIQKRSLKTIYPGNDYSTCLTLCGLPTLFTRRKTLCEAYFNKIKRNDHKLHDLLPAERNVQYDFRNMNILPVPYARTNRFKNSFIPWCLNHFQ